MCCNITRSATQKSGVLASSKPVIDTLLKDVSIWIFLRTLRKGKDGKKIHNKVLVNVSHGIFSQ